MSPVADPVRYANAVRVDRELVAVLESNRHRSPEVVAECVETTERTRRLEFRTRIWPPPMKRSRDSSAWYAAQIEAAKTKADRAEAILALPPITDLAHNDWRKREAASDRSLDRERDRARAQADLVAARNRLAWLEARALGRSRA